ncbi:hypothetical protein AOLI_G00241120 [Acnodon oligacanthus]
MVPSDHNNLRIQNVLRYSSLLVTFAAYAFQWRQSSCDSVKGKGLYLDSSTPALAHCIRYGSTRRVNHCHESNKAQVLSGKVQLFSIKCKALWELVIREAKMAETCKERI